MSRLLPLRGTVSLRSDREPRLINIDDEAADEVFEALSPKTARTIFSSLHDEPATTSDLADVADTSLQNVRYHLDKLAAAGLIEITDTWYSEQGREMKVYAPANTSLVMMTGENPPEATLRNLLKNLFGGIGILAIVSILFERLVRLRNESDGPTSVSTGLGTPTPRVQTVRVEETVANQTATATPNATPTPPATTPAPTTPTPASGIDGGAMLIDLLGVSVPPGGVFFIGGLFVLLLGPGWHYHRLPPFTR